MTPVTVIIIVCIVVMLVSIGIVGYYLGKRTSLPPIDYHRVIEAMTRKIEAKEDEIIQLEAKAKELAKQLKALGEDNEAAEEERKEDHAKIERGSMSDIDGIIYDHHQSVKRRS